MLNLSSAFFSLKDNIHDYLLMNFFSADCICCSIKCMQYRYSWHTCMPAWHPLLYSKGCSQLKKSFIEDGHGYCLSETKKTHIEQKVWEF
jgi:hypothetical protein